MRGTCVVCFDVNVKIFDIKATDLQTVYEKMTDSKIQNDAHCLCYICRARLQQCNLLLKLTPNLQRSPQDDNNEIEGESLVQLSTLKMESAPTDGEDSYPNQAIIINPSPSTADHNPPLMNTKTADPLLLASYLQGDLDRNERTIYSQDVKEESVEYNPEEFKCEVTVEPSTSAFYNRELKQEKTMDKDLKEDNVQDNADIFEDDTAEETDSLYKCGFKEPERTHNDDKIYTCDICNRIFNRKYTLKTHLRTHNSGKPYHCDICNKKFKHRGYFNIHKRTHTDDKSFQCDICNKKLSSSNSLRGHIIRRHTNRKKSYTCNICNKKFKDSSYLNIHKRLHSGERPYQCDICNKKFNSSYSLKIHIRTHTGEKPYSCNMCYKKFNNAGALNYHKKIRGTAIHYS